MLHIYTVKPQRAIKYRNPYVKRWFIHPRKRRFWAACCRKFHNAENMTVQVYYDIIYYSCAKGKGCRVGDERKNSYRKS